MKRLDRTELKHGAGSVGIPFLLLLIAALSMVTVSFAQQVVTDEDQDGMDDAWETENGLDPTDPSDAVLDGDDDGLNNSIEFQSGTDPASNDTDQDGMPDGWEYDHLFDPLDPADAYDDPDRDDRNNLEEYLDGTDPRTYEDITVDDDDIAPEDPDDMGSMASVFLCAPLLFIAGAIIVIIFIVGIYTKIKRERLLEHQTRQKIVDHIRENPGTYYSAMRKDLSLPHGVLTHHLNMLETQELIFSKQDRQFRRFYVDGMNGKGPLVTGSQRLVLEAVRKNPGSSQSQIARKLGISRMLVSYHVSGLDSLGLIEKRTWGREVLLYPVSLDKDDNPVMEDEAPTVTVPPTNMDPPQVEA